MYEVVKTIIDDVIMAPGVAPITTAIIVIMIAMTAASVLAEGNE
jgi:hypothetical protein